MRVPHLASFCLIGWALGVAVTGCGGTATLVDPSSVEAARQLKASTAPVVVAATPTPAPTPTPAIAKLQVSVTNFNKALLGLGKSTATVTVRNPSNATLTGTVTVMFLKSSETTSDRVHTQAVTLTAGAQQTLSIIETTWLMSSASASVETANGGYDPYSKGSSVY